MKTILPLVLSGIMGFSSLCFGAESTFFLNRTLPEPNKTLPFIPKFTHTPTSCSLFDKALCTLDLKNSELLDDIMLVFSKKEGNQTVFTTDHFEELLEKMREINITPEEFKENPNLCMQKIQPILEILSKHAGIPIDENYVKEICEDVSASLASVTQLYGVSQKILNNAQQSILTGMGIGVLGILYSCSPSKQTISAFAGGAMIVYMLVNRGVFLGI